jgi:hypothetical protein
MRKPGVILILILVIPFLLQAQEGRTKKKLLLPDKYLFKTYASGSTMLTNAEYRLYRLIMEYRSLQGKDTIPLSASLTHVAQTHTGDLTEHYTVNGKCDMHSWSNKGYWTSCCYTRDHAHADCSWSKPREMTPYTGDGFEVVYFDYQVPVPENVLDKWKKNPTNNDMLLNIGEWAGENWKAIGVGIFGNYASVWLGKVPDKEGFPGGN